MGIERHAHRSERDDPKVPLDKPHGVGDHEPYPVPRDNSDGRTRRRAIERGIEEVASGDLATGGDIFDHHVALAVATPPSLDEGPMVVAIRTRGDALLLLHARQPTSRRRWWR